MIPGNELNRALVRLLFFSPAIFLCVSCGLLSNQPHCAPLFFLLVLLQGASAFVVSRLVGFSPILVLVRSRERIYLLVLFFLRLRAHLFFSLKFSFFFTPLGFMFFFFPIVQIVEDFISAPQRHLGVRPNRGFHLCKIGCIPLFLCLHELNPLLPSFFSFCMFSYTVLKP